MEALKDWIDAVSSPAVLTTTVIVLFFLAIWARKLTTSVISYLILLVPVIAFFVSMTDPDFKVIVSKPDNVPIVIMLAITLFLTWFAMRMAVRNDGYIERGEDFPEKAEGKKKVLVWPNLVYIELICAVICTVVMIIWSLGLEAPLEEPAHPQLSPNPSKAPWYFLGLQEMLVYFDPWIAGVLLPGLIIVGLMAVPYLDPNPKGNGYYTFKERPFAITMFLFGYMVLWVFLIYIGTFLRGPNWNFFGPFEYWDIHKLEPLVNVNLSELFWVKALNSALPGNWLVREFPGLILVLLYFLILPTLLAKTVFRKMYVQMGFIRYNVMCFLFLTMLSMPIKMYLRWLINLKYIVAIPEYFFNI